MKEKNRQGPGSKPPGNEKNSESTKEKHKEKHNKKPRKKGADSLPFKSSKRENLEPLPSRKKDTEEKLGKRINKGSQIENKGSKSAPTSPRDGEIKPRTKLGSLINFGSLPNFFVSGPLSPRKHPQQNSHPEAGELSTLKPSTPRKRVEKEKEQEEWCFGSEENPTATEFSDGSLTDLTDLDEPENPQRSQRKFSRPSLLLEQLIDFNRHTDAWRKTLVFKIMADRNAERCEEFKKYLWYTRQSLQSMLSLGWQIPLQEIQKQEIELLEQIYKDYLDPVFAQYLNTITSEEEQEQALEFCAYLRQVAQAIMSNTLFDELPPLLNPAALELLKKLYPTVGFNEEQLEQRMREQLHIQPLRFSEVSEVHPSLKSIFQFFCDKLDMKKYNDLLSQLMDLTNLAALHFRISSSKTSTLRLEMENRRAPAKYRCLSAVFKQNEQLADATIKKLAKLIHDAQTKDKSLLALTPRCSEDEPDFYFPEGSYLLDTLAREIKDFLEEYKKLKKDKACFIGIMSTSLAGQLQDAIMQERYSEQTQSTVRLY